MYENPVKNARRFLGLTQLELANECGVSRQTVLRTEQGVYTSLPPSLGDWLTRDVPGIYSAYTSWQTAKRKHSYGRLIEPYSFDTANDNPFHRWRLDSGLTSRMGVCKDFCLHPAVVTKFENTLEHISVPDIILDALRDSGYAESTLTALQRAYSEYRGRALMKEPAPVGNAVGKRIVSVGKPVVDVELSGLSGELVV